MKGFIHIFRNNNQSNLDLNVEKLLKNYKTPHISVQEKSNDKINSFYFTNELEKIDTDLNNNNDVLFTPVGIYTKKLNEIMSNLNQENISTELNFVRNLEGQFALAYSDFKLNTITAYSHVARIETIYSYVSENETIIGTDPLIISLIAYNGKIEFDTNSMYSFLSNGYYSDNQTPFRNVVALPGNSFIRIDANGLSVQDIDDLYENLLNTDYKDSDYDQLTETFLNAFNTQSKDKPFNLALTGGKDSRLIFAAMNSNNFDMSVFTNGFDDNPDVIIAKKIADMYGIDHKQTSPKISDENTISVNVYNKIKQVMLSTSGMVYGYENVGALGQFRGDKSFDGVGAELVKGGFSAFINSDDNSDKNKLVTLFNKNHKYFLKDRKNEFEEFLKDFIDNDLGLHKLQILYSLKFRTGRLTSAAKNASNYSRQSHSPFLDNKFLKDALKIQYSDNKNEEIHYQILKRIDPRLINIPFGKDRWRVEKDKPLFPNDFSNWYKRKPIYPDTVLGNYNWRKVQNNDPKITQQFKNIILSNENHLVYDIVNYKEVEKILNNKIRPIHMRFIWSLASLIVFINELSDNTQNIKSEKITLHLPSTSITEFKNKKELFNITNEFKATNKSLTKVSEGSFIINNMDYNRVLKAFEGKVVESPTSISLTTQKQLIIRANIQSSKNPENITLQIIYYKNGKRRKNMFAESMLKNNGIEFEHINNLDGSYDSFRVLINLKDTEINSEIDIKYAFYEYVY